MQNRTRRTVGVALASAFTLAAAAPAADAADRIYGLTTSDKLVSFSSSTPAKVGAATAITGLGAGEDVVGIDVRPATGQLYGVTKKADDSTGRVYVIDPATGAASLVTTTPFALNGTDFGVDFNPVPDRIRLVSDAGQNLRLNPNNGNLGVTDGALAYSGSDTNAGDTPNVSAAAYTDPVPGNPTPDSAPAATQLFVIDVSNDVLALQDPPNNGILNTKGSLGLDVQESAGFDIAPQGNAAYAVLLPAGATRPRLYSVNLGSGRAVSIAQIGLSSETVDDVAVAQETFIAAAVTSAGQLQRVVRFRTDKPGTLLSNVPLSGIPANERIVGIDARPANGTVTGVTDASRLVDLDPVTGVASNPRAITPVGLSSTRVGVDFNPVPDRLRVVGTAEQNQRLNPDTGASGVLASPFTDTNLAYAAGDPNAGQDPAIVGAAYTNSVPGATETLLYVLDKNRATLALQGNPSPNDGQLRTIGTTGIGFQFDVKAGLDAAPGLDTLFAALRPIGSSASSFYAINGSSFNAGGTDQRGQAVRIGAIGAGDLFIESLAVLPNP